VGALSRRGLAATIARALDVSCTLVNTVRWMLGARAEESGEVLRFLLRSWPLHVSMGRG